MVQAPTVNREALKAYLCGKFMFKAETSVKRGFYKLMKPYVASEKGTAELVNLAITDSTHRQRLILLYWIWISVSALPH